MGLEKIRQTILAEANAKASRIIDAAKKAAAEMVKSKKEIAEQEYERIGKYRMQAIEEEYNRKLIQFKGLAGKKILDKRNALLRSLFQRAKNEILSWPQEKYATVMKRLVEKAAGKDGGELKVHLNDVDVFTKILSEVNEKREAKITLRTDEYLSERGGFIFMSGDFEVDQTLDTILREVEYELLPDVAATLFQKQ